MPIDPRSGADAGSMIDNDPGAADVPRYSRDPIIVRPLNAEQLEGWTRFGCRVDGCPEAPGFLFFDVEQQHAPSALESGDPFVLALLFAAMRAGLDLEVQAPVSPRLLENLDRFMLIWSRWCPGMYHRIVIRGEGEPSRKVSPRPEGVVLFSGGVDSAFTLWRHHHGQGGANNRDITLALFVQGADIPLDHSRLLDAAVTAAGRMAGSLGVDLATVRTNARAFPQNWPHAHGAILAGCLHLFSASRQFGLIGATLTIGEYDAPWGSHPMTDLLLGSGTFHVHDDGFDTSRIEKIAAIGAWPAVQEDLRVCYALDEGGANCGVCRKCVLTKLAFLASGHPIPSPLGGTPPVSAILGLRGGPPWVSDHLENALGRARNRGRTSSSWALALRLICLARRGGRVGTGMAAVLAGVARVLESLPKEKGTSL